MSELAEAWIYYIDEPKVHKFSEARRQRPFENGVIVIFLGIRRKIFFAISLTLLVVWVTLLITLLTVNIYYLILISIL